MLSYFELALKEAMQGVEQGDSAPLDQIIALTHDFLNHIERLKSI